MDLVLHNCPYRYELENLCRLFFFTEGVRVTDEPVDPERRIDAWLEEDSAAETLARVQVRLDGGRYADARRVSRSSPTYPDDCEMALSLMLFALLCAHTPVRPRWGVLTGVRPVKWVGRLWREGYDDEGVLRTLTERYLVLPEKARLALETARNERSITANAHPLDCSLYVSIPFCPSRCSYCSFVSQATASAHRLIPRYVELLCEELACVGEKVRRNGLRLKTVYFGGGTPSVLSAEQLSVLTDCVAECFDLSGLEEYTVEAGRPDTITREKLRALRRAGITRISINPQTLNDRVLEAIGRRHTAQQALDAFAMAREEGFSDINMDLIAGLPSDTLDSFADTLTRILALRPENLTVHTLSLKRSSTLRTEGYDRDALYRNPAAEMMELAQRSISAAGYEPYYLYRQKNTLGNLENVGFSLEKQFGRYNVYIMEELHTIVAAGAGGVTKLVDLPHNRIRRVFDYKYPSEYIGGFDEMLRRKDEIDAFFA